MDMLASFNVLSDQTFKSPRVGSARQEVASACRNARDVSRQPGLRDRTPTNSAPNPVSSDVGTGVASSAEFGVVAGRWYISRHLLRRPTRATTPSSHPGAPIRPGHGPSSG